MSLNKIELDAIKSRFNHETASNADCGELLELIETLTGDIDAHGSITQRIVDNISQCVDVDFNVTVDKDAVKRFLKA